MAKILETLTQSNGQDAGRRVLPDVMPTAVMGTNDNCTVSKRSVEMLYYEKPHFYRYFVKKPKKRTALINRGYLLRMKAIESSLKSFLAKSSSKKIVVNLGCGYDALPFRAVSCWPELCDDTIFLDVDYETLVREKVQIIQQNPELSCLLGTVVSDSGPPVLLRSEKYMALGCDLAASAALETFLVTEFGSEADYFFISEVSITYMPVEDADAVISWIAKLKNAQFCLLEQCLPNGPNHPFASTMLKHFNKLHSPIRVVQRYQTIEAQKTRFLHYGWQSVNAYSLWDYWNQDFTAERRQALRSVEVFDEHEEFALYATHYFILIAGNFSHADEKGISFNLPEMPMNLPTPYRAPNRLPPRRDGAIYEQPPGVIMYHGGDDGRARLSNSQLLVWDSANQISDVEFDISARKHHTITRLGGLQNDGQGEYLLVGGRDDPQTPLRDCWLRKVGRWTRVQDLPTPLYRHAATSFYCGEQPVVMVYGGKTSHDQISSQWFCWEELLGWRELQVRSTQELVPRISASLVWSLENHRSTSGILMGGMDSSESVVNDAYYWTLYGSSIDLRPLYLDDDQQSLLRLGAVLMPYHDDHTFLLIGGIMGKGLPKKTAGPSAEITVFRFKYTNRDGSSLPQYDVSCVSEAVEMLPETIEQPLLLGHSAIVDSTGFSILGGGAICFSFGSHMNTTTWHFDDKEGWRTGLWSIPSTNVTNPEESIDGLKIEETEKEEVPDDSEKREILKTDGYIAVNRIRSAETLQKRMSKHKPCVWESVDLGFCTNRWTPEYLKQTLGPDREVEVHHAKEDIMRFESKNFEIRKESFSNFIDAVISGEKRYLRAVSVKDKHKPADFYQDFDELAADFQLPPFLQLAQDKQHSSIFRISGPVNMWLHYDTLPNILCQIRGTKRLLLFSPVDVALLKIPPGRSSSDLNVFDPTAWEKTSLRHTHPYEAFLRPGDVLYIPAFWCHAALPLDGLSIAINTFFKTDDQQYADGKDTYGNKDIPGYEHARNDINKAIGRFAGMSQNTRRFYLERLADELLQKARKKN